MLSYNEEILEILERRMHAKELHGYYGGVFSTDKKKFVAYTYVALDTVDINEYWYLVHMGQSTVGVEAGETKKYLDNGAFQYKTTEECLKEGLYNAFSMEYSGAYFEDRWFIVKELRFFGTKFSEEKAKELFSKTVDKPDLWESGIFAAELFEENPEIPGMRNVEWEEFPAPCWFISDLKAEQKRKINRAFTAYMNIAVVMPFFSDLQLRFPEAYSDFQSLIEDYTLIFPESKAYFLVVAMARHRVNGYRLVWFFYDTHVRKFYQWTYPRPKFSEGGYHYVFDIIELLSPVSNWDDDRFVNSSRTMEDERFWNEYVLRKEGDRYFGLEDLS